MCFKVKRKREETEVMDCPMCDGKGCNDCLGIGVVLGTQKTWVELRKIRRVVEAITTKKEGELMPLTLKEAIEILTIHNDHNPNFTDAERREAHQLGIEALKFTKGLREGLPPECYSPLPGETKD